MFSGTVAHGTIIQVLGSKWADEDIAAIVKFLPRRKVIDSITILPFKGSFQHMMGIEPIPRC